MAEAATKVDVVRGTCPQWLLNLDCLQDKIMEIIPRKRSNCSYKVRRWGLVKQGRPWLAEKRASEKRKNCASRWFANASFIESNQATYS